MLASCDYIKLLCASQASSNPIFKGFGIKKACLSSFDKGYSFLFSSNANFGLSQIRTDDLRPLKYIHLHAQPIRDLAFHPEQQDAIVASASIDKSLKLTSLLVDQVRLVSAALHAYVAHGVIYLSLAFSLRAKLLVFLELFQNDLSLVFLE